MTKIETKLLKCLELKVTFSRISEKNVCQMMSRVEIIDSKFTHWTCQTLKNENKISSKEHLAFD